MITSEPTNVASAAAAAAAAAVAAEANDDEAQEIAVWKHTTWRYLADNVLGALDLALQELERLDFLWGRIRLSKLTLSPAIKADLRVEGHLVVFANVELKLARPSRSASVLASLQQYCVLNQILEFHSIMQTQLQGLLGLRGFVHGALGDLQVTNSDCDVAFYQALVRKTHGDLAGVCTELRRMANVIRLPSRRRFPYSAFVDHSFKPNLPPEVVAEFSIHRGELTMEVFGLALTQKPLSDIPDGCCTKKEFVGCVCMSRGQKVEIVDYASISVPVPQLEEMLSHLEQQTTWLVHVRDNVKALQECLELRN